MAVAYSSIGTRSTASSGTSVTPALPASLAAGDLMVTTVLVKNNATISTPSGWNKIGQTNSGASFTVAVYWRIFVAGDAAPAYTWTGSVANGGVCARFTGTDSVAPILTTGTAATGSTSTHTSTAITSKAVNSLFIAIDAGAANTAFTTPSGWTASFDSAGATGANRISMVRKTNSSAGASSGAISTTGGNAAWVEQQFEIQPPETGSFAVTENADTASMAGTVVNSGSLAATESADTASFSGALENQGSLAVTESPDVAALSGTVVNDGVFAATENADTASFSGILAVIGTLAATESPDTASFTGISNGVNGAWRRRDRIIGKLRIPTWWFDVTG